MPAPDPHGVYLAPDGGQSLWLELWGASNPKHRKARAKRILFNLSRGRWCCPECGGFVPIYRRSDALYCREGCRKKAARRRKGASLPSITVSP